MNSPTKRGAGKSTPSEIDRLVSMAKKLTPEELDEYILSRFEKDLRFLKRLVMEKREKTEWVKKSPEVQFLLKKVENFYDDLIADGHVKKDFDLFKRRTLEGYKVSQAREEASPLIKELREMEDRNYKKAFRKMNRVYTIHYETLCDYYLVPLAQKICGRPIKAKAKVLGILSSYRKRKHEELFKSLVPQIRNSISHQDFIIDPKYPKITFYDRRRTPMELSIKEYRDKFWELFFLVIAFDIADFDLREGILDILLESVDVVDVFLKKHDLKWVRGANAPLTLLDLATLIKSRKISET